jgi:hypothetical protein
MTALEDDLDLDSFRKWARHAADWSVDSLPPSAIAP